MRVAVTPQVRSIGLQEDLRIHYLNLGACHKLLSAVPLRWLGGCCRVGGGVAFAREILLPKAAQRARVKMAGPVQRVFSCLTR